MQTGGGQEKGRRTGTENVAGIVGLGVAMRIARERRATESPRQARLRDRLISGVRTRVPDVVLNGHPTDRLPNNASFCVPGTDGESLIVALDLEGFAVSSGSACTSGETEPSHVLLALGLDREVAKGSLRVTVGRSTTEADVDAFVRALEHIVARLRNAGTYRGTSDANRIHRIQRGDFEFASGRERLDRRRRIRNRGIAGVLLWIAGRGLLRASDGRRHY